MNKTCFGTFIRTFLIIINSIILTIAVIILCSTILFSSRNDLRDKLQILNQLIKYNFLNEFYSGLYLISAIMICICSIGLYGVLKEDSKFLMLHLGLLIPFFLAQIIALSIITIGYLVIDAKLNKFLHFKISDYKNFTKQCDFLDLFLKNSTKSCCKIKQNDLISMCCDLNNSTQNSCSTKIITQSKNVISNYLFLFIYLFNFTLVNEFLVLIMVSFVLGKIVFKENNKTKRSNSTFY